MAGGSDLAVLSWTFGGADFGGVDGGLKTLGQSVSQLGIGPARWECDFSVSFGPFQCRT